MMKIIFYCILFTSFLYSNCFGQRTSKKESYVYLYDGSVYVGEILSEDLFEVSLKTKALKIVTLNKAFVKKIHSGKDVILTKKGKYHKKNKNFSTLDWMSGSNASGDGVTSLNFLTGKRLTPRLELGLGFGFMSASTSTNDFWRSQQFFNLHAHGKKYFNDNTVRPYVDARIGYSAGLGGTWRGTYKGGLYVNPGVGIQLANRKKLKWSFRLSQVIQQTSGTDNLPWFGPDPNAADATINYKNWLNRTAFSIGINF